MRITEVSRSILNKSLRRNPKKEPDGIQKAPEPTVAPEEPLEPVQSEYDRQQKLIRRYRAYAYHHKKRRIRKKYMKKLLEASPIDRLFFLIRNGGITTKIATENVRCLAKAVGKKYPANTALQPGWIGSHKLDHLDSKVKGGVR